ncbi:hypothetical protein [Planotetraspora sp. GP83]|uniref:hypothetical protein n=1 Tax=Planotetraspora sp. GP83 TaxID=3156264 RepID=UPI0035189306
MNVGSVGGPKFLDDLDQTDNVGVEFGQFLGGDHSYLQALRDADTPRHSTWNERGCDGRWLVLDISTGAGPVCEAGVSCPANMTRFFYQATTTGWRVVTATRSAGCSAVRKAEPAFPTALCSELQAVK